MERGELLEQRNRYKIENLKHYYKKNIEKLKQNNPFKTNPNKAAAKIRINNTLTGVCLTIFTLMWAISPERLTSEVLLQFIFAVPLLYVSNMAYTKIAYYKETKLWDILGWFTGTTASAFIFNIIGVLTFLLGYRKMTLIYFMFIWFLLIIHAAISVYYNPTQKLYKILKLLYFIAVQLIFGVFILFL